MKVGIITELSLDTVNYGNHLQAYALNYYINSIDKGINAETIIYTQQKYKYTSVWDYIIIKGKGLARIFLKKSNCKLVDKRYDAFRRFATDYIKMSPTFSAVQEMEVADYDCMVVGSDVVWIQVKGRINKVKFLQINNHRIQKRIAYAASFGEKCIPKANIPIISCFLKDFDFISMREKSGVDIVSQMGIDDVFHVCDPVLLLEKNFWRGIEEYPNEEEDLEKINDKKLKDSKYCFVYLLDYSDDKIKKICNAYSGTGLKIVVIPNTDGIMREQVNEDVSVIYIRYAGPKEWIWLVNHADTIITDSFHCMVFSCLFEKKFFCIKRNDRSFMVERLSDFLNYVGEETKMVDINQLKESDLQNWNYNEINKRIELLRGRSEQFLQSSLID